MGDEPGTAHFRRLKLEVRDAVEQPLARPRTMGAMWSLSSSISPFDKVLAGGLRSSGNGHVLAAGGFPCLRQRRVDSVVHEVEGGAALHLQGVA